MKIQEHGESGRPLKGVAKKFYQLMRAYRLEADALGIGGELYTSTVMKSVG